ncbi:FN3 domain-containing metallophosphoesterase family protein [Erysipelatoclostridium ramosum]|uniref:FN3 domain-containing metallophosphoesterase family protein n=1 Tax=Thomasclavelia ramosa TaxID=1547 RepID=UPI0018A0E94D|nr:FN3 domain-containing metallophosphoesterase family protein [Thomasclavelia ramosa]MDB7040940.1 FN3 domain-containing metallophosphoesterase family protein [Thomasclavelia ramosa]
MKKNKVLKVSMATLALLMSAGYVAQDYQVTPTYAETTKIGDSAQLISTATTWKYLDNNVDPGTETDRYAWTKADYNDSEWKSEAGKFGAKKGKLEDLGDGFVPTVLLNQYINGVNGDDIPAFFFRTTVNISNLDDFSSLSGKLYYDDAAIVYINGVKVASFDEPEGGFESNMSYGGSNASNPKEGVISLTKEQLKDVIKTGQNTIAVELHQGRASSSDIYFEFNNLQVDYGQEETTVEQKALNLTIGEDETKMNLTWYANTNTSGTVQLAKAGAMINGEFPSQFTTVEATNNQANDKGFYYNQATLANLEENTKYVYRVVNGDQVSKIYDFTTKNFDGSYNFIFAGDPQIGASGSASKDTEGWDKTLSDSINKFNPNFILSAGDQVNTASDENQYSGYLDHEELTSVPQATTIGNHDSSSNAYTQHFNLPNETAKGETAAGTDYWYVYNNTLFMNINTNNTSTAEHKAFMKEAIKENQDVRWKVVVFHHSVYSVASHSVESSILKRREELTPVFDDLGIDVVLMGHDHVYVRSNMMKGMKVSQETKDLTSVTDPEGILYLTANSASGSKYYDIKTNISTDFVAKMDQSKQRSISNIEVSENSFKVTTYLYNSNDNQWSTLDEFTINKSVETNNQEITLVPEETANDIRVVAPVGTVEKNSTLSAVEVNEGDLYQGIKNTLNTILGSDKDFKVFDLSLIKNGNIINPLGKVQLSLALPEGYDASKLLIYQVQDSQNNDITLNPITYTIKDGRIIIETASLGQFVLVNNVENKKPDTGNGSNTNLPTVKPSNTNNSTTTTNNKVVTGDNSNLIAWGTLLFTALGCSLVAYKSKKEEKLK